MPLNPEQPSPEQYEYLLEFLQLKIDTCYIRDYRNGFNRWITSTGIVRAVAASSSIALWAVWQKYAFLWASIIAASQLADALRDVFPFVKRRKALSAWVRQLNRLFILAQRDWAAIAGGRCTEKQLRKLLHTLRSRKQALESRYVPDGLVKKHKLFEAAEHEAVAYFESRYNMVQLRGGELNVGPSTKERIRGT